MARRRFWLNVFGSWRRQFSETLFTEIGEGGFFGETALSHGLNQRVFTVCSLTWCDLLTLSRRSTSFNHTDALANSPCPCCNGYHSQQPKALLHGYQANSPRPCCMAISSCLAARLSIQQTLPCCIAIKRSRPITCFPLASFSLWFVPLHRTGGS